MRHTKKEMRTLYVNWQKSGLSKRIFCKTNGLPYGTFMYWQKQLLISTPEEEQGFSEIPIRPVCSYPVEVIFPSGVRMVFQTTPSVDWLKALV